MAVKTLKGMNTPEHTKIFSRTRGVMLEIAVGPHGTSDKDNVTGGLVSKNPFLSTSQQKYMYAHPEILGKKGLKEWSSKTNFKSLPTKVKKK